MTAEPPVFASEAWARSHGCRSIASCNATPLAAFEAGAAAERQRCIDIADKAGAVYNSEDGYNPFSLLLGLEAP